MNDYKELISGIQGDAEFRHIISECGADGKVWFDKRFICDYVSHLKHIIEQLVKERDDEREAADEWQHRYFEQARKCSRLEQERDAYAKAFRITTSYEPLMNHAVVKVDYNTVKDCDHEELMRAIAYRLARTIEDARSTGG